jgi:hypothetical protein
MAAVPNIIRLRDPATCATCGTSLHAGTFVVWDGAAKTATCESCFADTVVNTPADQESTP